MHVKRNIAVCAGFLLVLMLGVMMVCGGCKSGGADWDYTGTFGKQNETTQPTQTEKTPATLNPNITPVDPSQGTEETTVPTTEGDNPVIPPVSGNTPGNTPGTTPDNTPGTTPVTPETTAPTQAPVPSETTQPSESTEPSETTQPSESTEPSETTPPTEPPAEPIYLTYEQYIALSGPEQEAYYDSFPSMSAFNAWYQKAWAEYDASIPRETIVDGNIDLN